MKVDGPSLLLDTLVFMQYSATKVQHIWVPLSHIQIKSKAMCIMLIMIARMWALDL